MSDFPTERILSESAKESGRLDLSTAAGGAASSDVPPELPVSRHRRPSSLYQSNLWRLGLALAQVLPPAAIERLSRGIGTLYYLCQPARRRIVIRNLLPVLGANQTQATRASATLFRNFASKLADLWRYESGLPIDRLVCDLQGWDTFLAAQNRGHGVLLLTAHLGNWELGAPLLASRGVKIAVVTLDEPDPRLTEMRKQSRARWGVETIVVGQDPFAFVEIIRRLERGETVALLVDRPFGGPSPQVQLFQQPFLASLAPTELARASGCVLLPVYLPRLNRGYGAIVLPEISYDRSLLRSREARGALTQKIINAFEPAIRQHFTQWYHFVPIWPNT